MIAANFAMLIVISVFLVFKFGEAQDTLTRIEKLLKELKEKEKE